MARAHVQECLTTGCNIVSHLIFFFLYFLSTTLFHFPFKIPPIFSKAWKKIRSFFLALIDGGCEGLVLMLLGCRVGPNLHQSLAKEKIMETKKSLLFILPSSSPYSKTEMWQTIDPSATLNGRDKRRWRPCGYSPLAQL